MTVYHIKSDYHSNPVRCNLTPLEVLNKVGAPHPSRWAGLLLTGFTPFVPEDNVDITRNSNLVKISYLIACGIALQVAESLFPHPIPVVRLGLANISTLLALQFFGFRSGFYVALMRPLIGSLFLGSFLSPAFILSLSGSLISCLIMWILLYPTFTKKIFSNIGISILGAIAHNLTQLTVAYLLFVRHQTVFLFLPVLLFSAVITGFFTGWCVNYVMKRLKDKNTEFLTTLLQLNIPQMQIPPADCTARPTGDLDAAFRDDFPAHSSASGVLHNNISQKVILKLFYCIAITIFAFALPDLKLLILVFFMSIFSILIFQVNVKRFSQRLYILWLLILSSVFIHLFFTPGKEIFAISVIKVTYQGLVNALNSVLRISSVLIVSTALMLSTSNTELIASVVKVSKLFGRKYQLVGKMPEVIFLISNYYFGFLLQKIQQTKPKTPKKILEALFL